MGQNEYGFILYATDPATGEIGTTESELRSMWDRAAQSLLGMTFEHGTVVDADFDKLDSERYRGVIHYAVGSDDNDWDIRKEISDKMPPLNVSVKPE
jgi:hypothetical protein